MLVKYHSVLSAAALYDNHNGTHVLYFRIAPVISGSAESTVYVPWAYGYLPMMLN